MSKDNVLGASAGSTISLLAINASTVSNAAEVFLFGLIGGIAGILGKMLVQWVTKKIKTKTEKSEKQ